MSIKLLLISTLNKIPYVGGMNKEISSLKKIPDILRDIFILRSFQSMK